MSPNVLQFRVIRVLAGAGLLRSVIDEGDVFALKVDRAVLARRRLAPRLVTDMQDTEHRAADRTGMGQPFLAVDEGRAGALRAAVVFVDDRAPPVHHLPLHVDGTWRRGVHRSLDAS